MIDTPVAPHDPALIEAMARAYCQAALGNRRCPCAGRPFNCANEHPGDQARIGLDALCQAHPGVAAVLRGEAVAVPKEATGAMRRVTWLTQYSLANEAQTIPASIEMVIALTERRLNDEKQRESDDLAYRAMLAASPYEKEPRT